MKSERFLRIAVCTLAPPALGALATMIATLIDDYKHGHLHSGAIPILSIIFFYGYILMGVQSAVYAFLIDLWLRRWNPKNSVRAYLTFVGFSILLGGLAGATPPWLWGESHQWRPIPFFVFTGLGIGLFMGIAVSRWLVERAVATAKSYGLRRT
jgi:hypothetical protein